MGVDGAGRLLVEQADGERVALDAGERSRVTISHEGDRHSRVRGSAATLRMSSSERHPRISRHARPQSRLHVTSWARTEPATRRLVSGDVAPAPVPARPRCSSAACALSGLVRGGAHGSPAGCWTIVRCSTFTGVGQAPLTPRIHGVALLADPLPFLLGAGALVVLALLRRRWLMALVVARDPAGANATTQWLKPALGDVRVVDLPGLPSAYIGSWPSGHSTAAMSLALCLVLVSGPRLRPLAALVGAGYAIAVGYALVVLGFHLPSDVLGGFLVAATFTLVGAAALAALEARDPARAGRAATPPGAAVRAGARHRGGAGRRDRRRRAADPPARDAARRARASDRGARRDRDRCARPDVDRRARARAAALRNGRSSGGRLDARCGADAAGEGQAADSTPSSSDVDAGVSASAAGLAAPPRRSTTLWRRLGRAFRSILRGRLRAARTLGSRRRLAIRRGSGLRPPWLGRSSGLRRSGLRRRRLRDRGGLRASLGGGRGGCTRILSDRLGRLRAAPRLGRNGCLSLQRRRFRRRGLRAPPGPGRNRCRRILSDRLRSCDRLRATPRLRHSGRLRLGLAHDRRDLRRGGRIIAGGLRGCAP